MIILRSWLQDYIPVQDLSDHHLAEILTQLGLEVENTLSYAPLHPNIVVGKVQAVRAHPHADSLSLCTVDIASTPSHSQSLKIVCGAKNVRAGMLVAVAQVGSVLPDNTPIKRARIRGEDSEGMLCSAQELGFPGPSSQTDEGILHIPATTTVKLGTTVETLYPMQDTLFDLAITPNRPDCLGYIGIARDLAAKLLRALHKPQNTCTKAVFDTRSKLQVRIEDSSLSSRFCALYIQNLPAGALSPLWMQHRLARSGIRSKNMVVDVTNYVLLEWGQPVHAYDYAALGTPPKLQVQRVGDLRTSASPSIITLDGKTRALEAEDIVITDGCDRILGIAGIMGGQKSEMQSDSPACVIEVAEFHALKIRQTRKRLKLSTEASHRFERGVDSTALPHIVYRVAQLLWDASTEQGYPTPEIASHLTETHPLPYEPARIALRVERARKILGWPQLQVEECIDILDGLECDLIDRKGSRLVLSIPSHRHDLQREVDLVEEIARIKGYDHIPETLPLRPTAFPTDDHPFLHWQEHSRQAMASLGFSEAIVYPFTDRQDYLRMNIAEDHPFFPTIEIKNPLSSAFSWLQSLQLVAMLRTLCHHHDHQHTGQRLFQVGRVYFVQNPCSSASSSSPSVHNRHSPLFQSYIGSHERPYFLHANTQESVQRPLEKTMLTALVDHPWQKKSWNQDPQKVTFFDLKQITESFFSQFCFHGHSYRLLTDYEVLFPFLNPKQSALITHADNIIGYLGLLHPEVCDRFDFGITAIPGVIEISLERFYAHAKNAAGLLHPPLPAPFPPCYRDLSLAVDSSLQHRDILQAITDFPQKTFLHKAELFDLYVSESLGDHKKAMTYSLCFLCRERTLKDREVDRELQQLVHHLEKTLGTQRR